MAYSIMRCKNRYISFQALNVIICILIFSFAKTAQPGVNPPPYASYPKIYLIIPDKGSVWFLGEPRGYPYRYASYIFEYDKDKNQWKTIYKVGGEKLGKIYDLRIDSEKVLFILENREVIYDKINREWSLRKANNQEYFRDYNALRKLDKISTNRMTKHEIEERSIVKKGYKYLLLEDRILKLKKDEVVGTFWLPQPTSEYLIQMRPKAKPYYREGAPIKNSIGPFFIEEDKIWFGITFYDGEGRWGLGGIGFFDTKEEKWGLLHLKILKASSVDCILRDGNRIWMGTSHHGEYGFSATSGLVMFDRVNGNYRYYTTKNSSISGDLVSSMAKDEDELWVATEYGMSRYNTRSKAWSNYSENCIAIDSDRVAVLPGISYMWGHEVPEQNLHPKGFLNRGNIHKWLWYCRSEDYDAQAKRWSYKGFYEIESSFNTIGWVGKRQFQEQNILYRKKEWLVWSTCSSISASIYSEDFKSPIGNVIAANLEKIEEKNGMVKILTDAGWISDDVAYPVFSEIKGEPKIGEGKTGSYKIKYSNLEQDMFQTAEMFIRQELADYTEIIIDKDYIVNEENLEYEIFDITDGGGQFRVWISADLNILSRYNPIEGAKKGVFSCSVWMADKRLYLSATGKDFRGFKSNELGLQKISKSIKIVEKSKSNNYKVSVEVVDYKTGKTKLGEKRNFKTDYVVEWVKFHVRITKRKGG